MNSYEEYLSKLESDKEVIFKLQQKYNSYFRAHMKMKKLERDADASWERTRTLLFHIAGALAMAGNGIRSYIKDDK